MAEPIWLHEAPDPACLVYEVTDQGVRLIAQLPGGDDGTREVVEGSAIGVE